jgi:hypothetical protein
VAADLLLAFLAALMGPSTGPVGDLQDQPLP